MAMETTLASADYQQLRGFVAVARLLSFSRAAGAMGVSPSALSQLVRGLEERLGTRLLNRTTRSVSLTEAGAALLARTEPALAVLGEAMLQARAGREAITGRVRVHASRFAGELYVQPILARFAREYPDVVLDVSLDDAVTDIVAGGHDLAIRIGELVERDMIALPLGREMRQLAVATPDYVAAHGVPDHPRDLLRHRCIRWRWPGNPAPYHWEFWDNGWFQVAVDGPLILDDKQACIEAALQGIGIAFAAEPKVRGLIETGRLVPMLERWSAPFPGHYLCYPQQRHMAPALRAFIDAVRRGA
jgi:DNA-binding transcriptional LysR family regulator